MASVELPTWGKACIVAALLGLLAAVGFGLAPSIAAGFGWRTRHGGPLDLDAALGTLHTAPDTPIPVHLEQGEAAVVVIVGTQLTGSDTTTADCSAQTPNGSKVEVEMRPSVETKTTSSTVRRDEEIVLDGAIRPGAARDLVVRCTMRDSGIRGIGVLHTRDLVFPEPIGWLTLARNIALAVLALGVAGAVAAVYAVQRRGR